MVAEIVGGGGGGGFRGGRGGGRGGFGGGWGGGPGAGPAVSALQTRDIIKLNKMLWGAKFTLTYASVLLLS